MMRSIVMLLMGALLAGCAGGTAEPQAEEETSPEETIAALESRLAELQEQHRQLRQDAQGKARECIERVGALEAELQRTTVQYERIVGNLRQQLAAATRPAAKPQVPAAPPDTPEEKVSEPVAESSPPPEARFSFVTTAAPGMDEFIEPPEDNNLCPVRVFDVAGKKIVTGSHLTSVYVETDKKVRDEFGRKVPAHELQDREANEYGYQVSFSVQNLTKTDKEITAKAGADPLRVTVPAGVTATNLVLKGAMGADLHVLAGEYLQRFPITY